MTCGLVVVGGVVGVLVGAVVLWRAIAPPHPVRPRSE
jgi:hypothetical protein